MYLRGRVLMDVPTSSLIFKRGWKIADALSTSSNDRMRYPELDEMSLANAQGNDS